VTTNQCGLAVPKKSKEKPRAQTEPKPQEAKPPQIERKKIAHVYTASQREEVLERAAAEGVSHVSQSTGISRAAIYDWKRKMRLIAEGKILNADENSGGSAQSANDRDALVLELWKKHPGLGPTQIRNQLRREKGMKISVHTVRCIMEEHGYQTPKVRRQTVHDQRYEALRPNQLWHLDFLHQFIHNQKIYVLLLLDDFSRFISGCAIWEGERADAVIATFEEAIGRHGRPERVISDGGSAFWSWRGVSRFTRYLEELNIDQMIAKIPEHNGKSEVLNANIRKELFAPQHFFDLQETQKKLAHWVNFYNFRRTNQALGGLLVPADRYFGRAQKVLSMIEAGRPPEGVDEPLAVEQRSLTLMQLKSQGGQIELWMMGQRLWPQG
jgi:transposase InsO family protein